MVSYTRGAQPVGSTYDCLIGKRQGLEGYFYVSKQFRHVKLVAISLIKLTKGRKYLFLGQQTFQYGT